MKAHHGNAVGRRDIGLLAAKWLSAAAGGDIVFAEAEFAVKRHQCLQPARLLRRIGRGLAVGKKVDVVRLVGAGLDGIELGAELFGCDMAAGSEPSAPARQAARASRLLCTPAIGA